VSDVAVQLFKLSLSISDTNDNNPVFEPSRLTLRVPENVPVGSDYALPAAVDRDHSPFDVQVGLLDYHRPSAYPPLTHTPNSKWTVMDGVQSLIGRLL